MMILNKVMFGYREYYSIISSLFLTYFISLLSCVRLSDINS